VIPRKGHLLANLLFCECGAPMIICSSNKPFGSRVGCQASYRDRSVCDHIRTYRLTVLTAELFKALKAQLQAPDAIADAARDYQERWAERQRRLRKESTGLRKLAADNAAAIKRMVTALEKGSLPEDVIYQRLEELETERRRLAERERELAPVNVVDFHPRAMELYRQQVNRLAAALNSDGATINPEHREALRALIDRVVLHKTEGKRGHQQPIEFTPYGRLSAMLGDDVGAGLFPSSERVRSGVAGLSDNVSNNNASVLRIIMA
jgi:site-specific DNA recombinase